MELIAGFPLGSRDVQTPSQQQRPLAPPPRPALLSSYQPHALQMEKRHLAFKYDGTKQKDVRGDYGAQPLGTEEVYGSEAAVEGEDQRTGLLSVRTRTACVDQEEHSGVHWDNFGSQRVGLRFESIS